MLFAPAFILAEAVKSPKSVTPAKAGVQNLLISLESRFCGNEKKEEILTFYKIITLESPVLSYMI
jgi:hypothetical protein